MPVGKKSKKKPARPNRNTDMWKPTEKGEELAGEIVRMDVVDTRHGETAVVEIEDEDGVTLGVWCGVQLGEKLYDAYDVGDSVIVTFQGKEETDSGNYVNVFDVEEWT